MLRSILTDRRENQAFYRTGDIGSPTGLVVPRAAIAYNPLNLQKSDGLASGACARPGEFVTYTISYKNENPYPLSGVVLTDTLAPEVDFVSASSGGSLSGGIVSWGVGSVASGESGSVTVTVRLKDGTAPGSITTDYASIDCDQTGAAYAQAQTPVCSNQPPLADARPEGAVFECTSAEGALVTLDGTASYDPDAGTTLGYAWSSAVLLVVHRLLRRQQAHGDRYGRRRRHHRVVRHRHRRQRQHQRQDLLAPRPAAAFGTQVTAPGEAVTQRLVPHDRLARAALEHGQRGIHLERVPGQRGA